MAILNTDVYNMSEVLLDVQKNVMEEEDEETLALGMYGYINAALSKLMTSNIRIAADNANEVFATKAKYEKNVITHAINAEITDINATPAKIPVIMCLLEDDLNVLFEQQGDHITISNECEFEVGDYEYHLDYPMIISRQLIENNKSVYTARYDNSFNNELSDVVNPYLPSPYIFRRNGYNYLFIVCSLRQVERDTEEYTVITSNPIDNKTHIFNFEGQLAGFEVYIISEEGFTKKLTPIFEGASIADNVTDYCWYTYIDQDSIRLKFDQDSIFPDINDVVRIVIYTTQGSECNFTYMDDILSTLEDTENYSYNSMEYVLIPQGNSAGGKNKKSINDLKRQLPKQSQSRGNIINHKDIINYFNSLSTEDTKIKPIQKVDNQIMREYYLYLLMKDDENVVVPTNTISILFDITKYSARHQVDGNTFQYTFNQGIIIGMNSGSPGKIINEDEIDNYEYIYTIPYKTIINTDGPFVSLFMDIINTSYDTSYDFINDYTPLQFISQVAYVKRDIGDDDYYITMSFRQNIDEDYGVIVTNEETGEITNNMVVVAVMYDSDGLPYRFFKSNLIDYTTDEAYTYTYQFKLESTGNIDADNKIFIENGYRAAHGEGLDYPVPTPGSLPQNCTTEIYVLCKFEGISSLDDKISSIIAGLDEYSCTNRYSIRGGLDLYQNYSGISSVVADVQDTDQNIFLVKGLPVIKYDYATNSEKMLKFINKLDSFREYIYDAINVIEGGFGVDFKYYNTYGPSYLYNVDKATATPLDKVNLILNIEVALKKVTDNYTKNFIIRDILAMIEDFDREDDIHISTIISNIYNTYQESIYYISFKGFNVFDATKDGLYAEECKELTDIPEFICIDRDTDNTPAINIKLANI